MEQYQFSKLIDLVLSAKSNIPFDKPVHLFGAGHPLIFPLIVALGCDMFDSAAYALFAKHDRVLSSEGTYRLTEIQDEFCSCPICSKYTIAEMKQLEKTKRVQVLAEHNLHICQIEIKRIKQAIREGRLWRLVESRLSSHPALVDAMLKLQPYQSFIEKSSPITKRRALYITSNWSLFQPEVYRHKKRFENYSSPEPQRNTLLLFSVPTTSPYHSSKEYERFRSQVQKVAPNYLVSSETLFISPIFGIVPLELTNYYPLAQNMVPQINMFEIESDIIEQLKSYISKNPQFIRIYGIFGNSDSWRAFTRRCRQILKQLKKNFILTSTDFSKESLNNVIMKLTSEIS